MSATIDAVWPGQPYPRGATWDGMGVNFALFSESAERVELCVFDASGRHELQRVRLREQTDQIWHAYLPQARPGMLYGWRVHGPYRPRDGHRFNPHKLLLDPYARNIVGALRWHDALFGYRIGHDERDLSFDRRDSAPYMPRCKVVDTAFSWGDDRPPRVPWHQTVIYELHVRGFTMRHPDVPPALRGTYAGLACAPVIDYLKRLGVTTVELMPVHAFVDDRHLLERGLRNYWGYNSIGFFAPERRYSASGKVGEFKTMVRTLHAAGIEVLLDVVYNHTAEGNEFGPTLSFRGIDNAAYYRLAPGEPRYYQDFTGCGNTLNLQHPRVLQLLMDSLRYWVTEMHVDGFRFDLASALARELHEVDKLSALLRRAAPGPGAVARQAHRRALGSRFRRLPGRQLPGRLGRVERPLPRHHARLLEGRGRPDRRVRAAPDRLVGSLQPQRPQALRQHQFRRRARRLHARRPGQLQRASTTRPMARTTATATTTTCRGTAASRARATTRPCARCARASSATSSPRCCCRRACRCCWPATRSAARSGATTTPTAQDNETSWVDWALDDAKRALLEFSCRLVALRAAHPAFHRRDFFQGRPLYGSQVHDIVWLQPDGSEMTEASWSHSHARALAVFLAGEGLNEVDGRGRRADRRRLPAAVQCRRTGDRFRAAGDAGRALRRGAGRHRVGRRCADRPRSLPAPSAMR